jgi:hypothetical protein
MRRGFDGLPASTVTLGSTLADCRGEGSEAWVCAFTLDAVAITQASATLNPQVDKRHALLLESSAKVLQGISNVPQTLIQCQGPYRVVISSTIIHARVSSYYKLPRCSSRRSNSAGRCPIASVAIGRTSSFERFHFRGAAFADRDERFAFEFFRHGSM